MRERLELAICSGLISTMDERLKKLLDDFEASIVNYADNEAAKRAKAYYDELNSIPDGNPIFDKNRAVDNEDQAKD